MLRRRSYFVTLGACVSISSCNGLLGIEAPEDKMHEAGGPNVDASGPDAPSNDAPSNDASVEASARDASVDSPDRSVSDAPGNMADASIDAPEGSTTDVFVGSERADADAGAEDGSCNGGLMRCPSGCFDTTSDLGHCGGCDTPCSPVAREVATCMSGMCKSYVLTTAPGKQSPLIGYDSGGAFSMLCPPNEIVVGIEGIGADLDASTPFDTVWGITAHCAHLGLRRTLTGYAVDVFPDPNALPIQGGNIAPPPARFIFNCPQTPEPTIVSEVSGSTGRPGQYTEGLNVITVGCSTVRVDALLRVTVAPPIVTRTIGSSQGHVIEFSNTCDPGAAVNGFTGRSGAYVDAFSVSCANLSVTLK